MLSVLLPPRGLPVGGGPAALMPSDDDDNAAVLEIFCIYRFCDDDEDDGYVCVVSRWRRRAAQPAT